MKEYKILKRLLIAVSCLVICFGMNTQLTQAAAKTTSYKITSNSNLHDAKIKIKGNEKKQIMLNVKSKGNLRLVLDGDKSLTDNEQVKIIVVDKKGKKVGSASTKNMKHGYISVYAKPGTYKVTMTTKNIKKTKTRALEFSYILNNTNKKLQIKADGKPVYDISNDVRRTELEYINDKDQVVRFIEDGGKGYRFRLYDGNGKELFDELGNQSSSRYLKKGTYRLIVDSRKLSAVKVRAVALEKLSKQLTSNAVSKEKAVVYDGKAVNFACYNEGTGLHRQWMKVDTSKFDINLALKSPEGVETYPWHEAVVYDENGKFVKYYESYGDELTSIDPYGIIEKGRKKGIYLKKDTGVYYILVQTQRMCFTTLAPISTK